MRASSFRLPGFNGEMPSSVMKKHFAKGNILKIWLGGCYGSRGLKSIVGGKAWLQVDMVAGTEAEGSRLTLQAESRERESTAFKRSVTYILPPTRPQSIQTASLTGPTTHMSESIRDILIQTTTDCIFKLWALLLDLLRPASGFNNDSMTSNTV